MPTGTALHSDDGAQLARPALDRRTDANEPPLSGGVDGDLRDCRPIDPLEELKSLQDSPAVRDRQKA
eukprot:7562159-Alexandrium_andersonii.AAC.1